MNCSGYHERGRPSFDCQSQARQEVLEFCNADPSEEYEVIWTANASGALKVVGESYPFVRNSAFLYAPDCHNSVLGISKFAAKKKARVGGFHFLGDSLCRALPSAWINWQARSPARLPSCLPSPESPTRAASSTTFDAILTTPTSVVGTYASI